MRAAQFYKAGDMRIEEIPEPNAGPGEVKLRIDWCGICGTDIAEYKYGPVGTPIEPHPLTGAKLPIVLGHEIAGTVIEVGAGAKGAKLGDRVLVDPILRCNSCRHCQRDQHNICDFLGVHGLSGGGGGLAEFTVVPDYTLHRLPDGLESDIATLAEPVAVGLRALKRSRLSPEATVCLIGAGPVGMILVACISSQHGTAPVVIEPSPFRRRIIRDLGCELAVAPDQFFDTAMSKGPFDIVFETSGTSQGLESALAATSPGGTLVHVARFKQAAQIDPNLLRREIDLISTQAYVDEIPQAIDFVASQKTRLQPIVSDRVNLSRVIEKGFQPLSEHPVKMGKVLVSCQETAV